MTFLGRGPGNVSIVSLESFESVGENVAVRLGHGLVAGTAEVGQGLAHADAL